MLIISVRMYLSLYDLVCAKCIEKNEKNVYNEET